MDNPRPEKVAVVDEVRDALQRRRCRPAHRVPRHQRRRSRRRCAVRFARPAASTRSTRTRSCASRPRDLGLDLDDQLTGPTAIAFVPTGGGGDPVAVAKALREFAKGNPNLVVKGGVLGEKLLSRRRRQGPRRGRSPRGAARQAGRPHGRPDAAVRRPAAGRPAGLRLRPARPSSRRAAPPVPPPRPRPPPTRPAAAEAAADRGPCRRGRPTADADIR